MNELYQILGVPKTASMLEIKEASVLSNPEQRALYNALGPEKYDDPREVFRYHVEREVDRREMKREYEAYKSAEHNDLAESMSVILFGLFMIDLVIPSWVLGPWYYIANAFLLLSLLSGVYYWVNV